LTGVASPGKILEADLTTGELAERPIPQETWERFLGGLGLNAWLLYRNTGPATDPLGPENVVLISPGLLTGTEAPTSPRVEVTTKSPLTGLIGTGNSGGHWGPRLKKAGIDSVMVRGASEKPSYLVIDEGDASLRDAGDLWVLDPVEGTWEEIGAAVIEAEEEQQEEETTGTGIPGFPFASLALGVLISMVFLSMGAYRRQ